MTIKKYTLQQSCLKDAGITLCVECPIGFNGDKSCGSNGMQKLPKYSPCGCFRAGSFNNNKNKRIKNDK